MTICWLLDVPSSERRTGDASIWNDVIARLQHDGYPVVAPANPLRGLVSASDYLESFVKSVKGPVVLVGHSYGGAVISDAAAGNPEVKVLVYIASFIPEKGESFTEVGSKFPGATLASAFDAVPFPLPGGGTGTDLYVQKDKFHDAFAADVPESVTDLMAATQRPLAASRFMAARAHSRTIEVKSSHAVLISHPGAVANLIRQAAGTSTR
ncbi:alpha/beta fold hydrolase [Streptomyces sp. NPDC057757]|uniref:alpha/beta fold hydrolase n=1 Tax=Streptomyces sp. NPDC057757 TaxID=3346241 RepID=UPI0036969721